MKRFGLIGYPLRQSFSPAWFAQKFERLGVEASYGLFPMASLDQLPEWIAHEKLNGLNVTIPHKVSVIPFLDELDEEAAALGAVNTIHIRFSDAKPFLKGYNTDVIGFRQSLMTFSNPLPQGALVLGTGGAARAVLYVLQQLKIPYKHISRRPQYDELSYHQLDAQLLQAYPLIINATPLGMAPDYVLQCPELPYELLNANNLLYDLVYQPAETLFLKKGLAQGCSVKNGLEMLHLQADAAWGIWQL
ncbi:MAG: shikimate dehydrogenase family protein [Bacteroidia bacterium]